MSNINQGRPFDVFNAQRKDQINRLQKLDANKKIPGAEKEDEPSFADILLDIINEEAEKFEEKKELEKNQKIKPNLGKFDYDDKLL